MTLITFRQYCCSDAEIAADQILEHFPPYTRYELRSNQNETEFYLYVYSDLQTIDRIIIGCLMQHTYTWYIDLNVEITKYMYETTKIIKRKNFK